VSVAMARTFGTTMTKGQEQGDQRQSECAMHILQVHMYVLQPLLP
jgi:hypothetical protein